MVLKPGWESTLKSRHVGTTWEVCIPDEGADYLLVRCPECQRPLAEVLPDYRGSSVRVLCRRCKVKTRLVAAESW